MTTSNTPAIPPTLESPAAAIPPIESFKTRNQALKAGHTDEAWDTYYTAKRKATKAQSTQKGRDTARIEQFGTADPATAERVGVYNRNLQKWQGSDLRSQQREALSKKMLSEATEQGIDPGLAQAGIEPLFNKKPFERAAQTEGSIHLKLVGDWIDQNNPDKSKSFSNHVKRIKNDNWKWASDTLDHGRFGIPDEVAGQLRQQAADHAQRFTSLLDEKGDYGPKIQQDLAAQPTKGYDQGWGIGGPSDRAAKTKASPMQQQVLDVLNTSGSVLHGPTADFLQGRLEGGDLKAFRKGRSIYEGAPNSFVTTSHETNTGNTRFHASGKNPANPQSSKDIRAVTDFANAEPIGEGAQQVMEEHLIAQSGTARESPAEVQRRIDHFQQALANNPGILDHLEANPQSFEEVGKILFPNFKPEHDAKLFRGLLEYNRLAKEGWNPQSVSGYATGQDGASSVFQQIGGFLNRPDLGGGWNQGGPEDKPHDPATFVHQNLPAAAKAGVVTPEQAQSIDELVNMLGDMRKVFKQATNNSPYGVTSDGLRDALQKMAEEKGLDLPYEAAGEAARGLLKATEFAIPEVKAWNQFNRQVHMALKVAGVKDPKIKSLLGGTVDFNNKLVESKYRGAGGRSIEVKGEVSDPNKNASGSAARLTQATDADLLGHTILNLRDQGVNQIRANHDEIEVPLGHARRAKQAYDTGLSQVHGGQRALGNYLTQVKDMIGNHPQANKILGDAYANLSQHFGGQNGKPAINHDQPRGNTLTFKRGGLVGPE